MANTPTSSTPRRVAGAIEDSKLIRRSALQYKVHYDTTLNGGFATTMALNADATEKVISVQEMHALIGKYRPPARFPGRIYDPDSQA